MSSVLLSNFCFTSSQTALARLTGISPLHGSHVAVLHGNHLADDDSWNTGINRSLSFLTGHGAPVPSARFLSQRI
ncbi:hypothetical protein [Streptococcus mutans]|uniref:hypothetical protein n=1 Tax=Streptococcus mutans TaxID=1309 RepID=UPI0003827037|nr:hypothetical protein [Streptococcus mutans]